MGIDCGRPPQPHQQPLLTCSVVRPTGFLHVCVHLENSHTQMGLHLGTAHYTLDSQQVQVLLQKITPTELMRGSSFVEFHDVLQDEGGGREEVLLLAPQWDLHARCSALLHSSGSQI